MSRFFYLATYLLLCAMPYIFFAQPNYTANDLVKPYKGDYGIGTNVGYFPNWKVTELGDIAIGNARLGIEGVGVTTLRHALFEYFQEQWGYEFRIPAFQHYKEIGATDQVVFVGYPNEAHRDTFTYKCPNGVERYALFKNLYEPIWDDGVNGTPVNEDNYYASYLYKTVSLYKEYVKFWEIWNEPDFSTSPNSIYQPGIKGNWWENNPNPCDYDIHAPVYHYIRMLRISWEIIKTIDPDAYVAIGGIGYPSFLDAVLRNTDNPSGGRVSSEYPLGGGAYFDVLSYHTYPHIDGSLRTWNNDLNGFLYKRHTDAAVEGVIQLKNEFQAVLAKYGYNGDRYPEKEWIITESNVPRKPLNEGFGSEEVQRNFIVKALVETWKNDIKQFHIFTLGDKMDFSSATRQYQEYDLMGLFKNMNTTTPYNHEPNDIAIAYKTTSDLLHGATYDKAHFENLDLPLNVRGGAFKHPNGKMTYVLWTATREDNSETVNALSVVDLRRILGAKEMVKKQWNYAETKDSIILNAQNVTLRGEPAFFEISELVGEDDDENNGNPYVLDVYPNPFSTSLVINFKVSTPQDISISIVDQLGRPYLSIVDYTRYIPGNYTEVIAADSFEAGVYFLHYETSELSHVKKVLLLKEN